MRESGEDGDDLRVTLERYLKAAEDDDAELKVCALHTPRDTLRLLDDSANTLMMVIVSADNAPIVRELTSPAASKALRGSGCSVLVVGSQARGWVSAEDGSRFTPAQPDAD